MVPITLADFLADPHGKRFTDVVNSKKFNFNGMIEFFNDRERQHMMLICATRFGFPALAGVIKELEQHPSFAFLASDKHETIRLRQAIGVLAKVIMEKNGHTKTGNKGSLCSLSKYFTVAEIYAPPSA